MTSLQTLQLFDLNIINARAKTALKALLADRARKKAAAFVNAHCINVAAGDAAYRWALSQMEFILPDGSGLQLAARIHGQRFVDNLNGTDLFLPLCRAAAENDQSIFFFGSQPGVAEGAARTGVQQVPGLEIAGSRHGFFESDEEESIIAEINASGADIVLVALGVPLQETWIARNRHRLNAHLVMGVGAQFDFWSGRVSRAPTIMRRLGLEWTWRLAIEPKRMARRYLLGNPAFVLRSIRERLCRGDNHDISGKRALDLLISSSAILLLAPMLLGAAAAIRLESKGPVIFRQIRIGKGGKPFTVLKFRSMYADAEQRRAALLDSSDRAGICFKAKSDPRITRVGRFLRRYSLDELPQIFNVWRGEMGIVGPRPALPQEVEAYPAEARERLAAKPGLTGLWQVSGRAEIGFDRMVDMDTAYVRSRSLVLDIAIIALTFRAVVSGRGAY